MQAKGRGRLLKVAGDKWYSISGGDQSKCKEFSPLGPWMPEGSDNIFQVLEGEKLQFQILYVTKKCLEMKGKRKLNEWTLRIASKHL